MVSFNWMPREAPGTSAITPFRASARRCSSAALADLNPSSCAISARVGGMPVSAMARWMRRRISVCRGVRSDMACFRDELLLKCCRDDTGSCDTQTGDCDTQTWHCGTQTGTTFRTPTPPVDPYSTCAFIQPQAPLGPFRCDRHRGRPQWPDLCLLSREIRSQGRSLRAPPHRRRHGGDRGVPPRLPQFHGQLHRLPARPQGERRTAPRRARPARSIERPMQNFLPLPDGDSFSAGPAFDDTLAEARRFSARDAARLPDYYAMLEARGRAAAHAARAHPADRPAAARATCGRRCPSVAASARCRSPRSARSTSSSRAAPARSSTLVRERAAQGAARLRLGGRQLREPLHARQRLRAAAPRLRRGERQARQLGPRNRRHGRDHPGHGARGRAPRRAHRTRRAGAPRADAARGGTAHRDGIELEDGRVFEAPRIAANIGPKPLFLSLLDADDLPADFRAHIERFRAGSATFRMNVALAAPPRFDRAAHAQRRCAPRRRHPHRAVAALHGPRLRRGAPARRVAPAGGRDADPLDARRLAGAARRARREPLLPALRLPPARRPQLAGRCRARRRRRPRDRHRRRAGAPDFRASVLGRSALSPLDLERASASPAATSSTARWGSTSCGQHAPFWDTVITVQE
jgi:hypothetical protein